MTSAFPRLPSAANAAPPRRRGPWGSTPFRVALVAGLLAAAVSWGGGQYLAESQYREESKAIGTAMQPLGRGLADALVAPLDRGDLLAGMRQMRVALERLPEADAVLLDADGAVLLGPMTSSELPALDAVKDLNNPGLSRGRYGDIRVVQWQGQVHGRTDALGTLVLRLPVPGPVWAGALLNFVAVASIFAAVASFIYLSAALRGIAGARRVLARASQGDYCERATVVGCTEVKQLVRDAHGALDAFIVSGEEARKVYVETAIALSKTIEAKDRYTSGHSQRVAIYSVEIGEEMGLPAERVETLRLGALLHDIGKVSTPDHVLLKPSALDDDEFELMKKHPMAGDRILSAIPGLRDMADIARSHHEKWDGSGYPMGVSGDSIPLEGRIVAIADAYDALVTKRSYKPAMPVAKALAILEKDAGTHFDPELVRLFVAMKKAGRGYKPLKAEKGGVEAPTRAKRREQAGASGEA